MKVIITAAARGIGFAIAKRFASDGASVFICDIDGDALAETVANNANMDGMVADVSKHDEVPGFIAAAVESLGGIDVLINNVGIAGPTGLIEDTPFDGWDEAMQVNLGSHFYCAHEVIPHMKAQKTGLIINISSIAGQFGYPHHSAYAVSKAAVIALTNTLAMELGPDGIRANAIAPCAVDGPRMDSVIEVEAESRGLPVDTVRQAYYRQTSMRKFIDADEIAALAFYLASPAARSISGQTIAVDGNAETLRT